MANSIPSLLRQFTALTCAFWLVPGDALPAASVPNSWQPSAPQDQVTRIPNDQLDSLVAPIALYPDPLLAQVLAASTYPLELVQLSQWLDRNKGLQDQALADAVAKQDWDPSIQAMAAFPDLVKRLTQDIQWTTDLGNAFLAQESSVMDAVQRMRLKARNAGNLKSGEQQKVETQVVEGKTVVVIQQANPQVIYVPTYNPVVVFGPPLYPYPPIYYPPPGYYAAGLFISFGVGVAIGAAWRGGWGYGCGWGRSNTIIINRNNYYINHYNRKTINVSNRQNINVANRPGNNSWQHNPRHRGGAPYSNPTIANKYGGTARGASMETRQTNARLQQSQGVTRQQANPRPNQGQLGNRQEAAANSSAVARPANPGANRQGDRAASSADRIGKSNAAARPASPGKNRPVDAVGPSGDRIGNHNVSPRPSAGTKSGGAFAGFSGSGSSSSARASSLRGASSMNAARGGARRSS